MLGWKQLIEGWPWFRGEGSYPLLPNSEYMPPVRLIRKPYGTWDGMHVSEDDPWGWPISEYEEALSLRPGLHEIARHVLDRLVPLCRGQKTHGISEYKLRDNPCWPADLAKRAPALKHERFVLLLPLALSITQDFMAHLRWTLFGNSEQGPARAFWMGFYTNPGQELPIEQALEFFRALLGQAYRESAAKLADLRAAGFRILPVKHGASASSHEEPWPTWADEYLLGEAEPLRGVKYLLTFRPFRDLPQAVKRNYFAGKLNLLPFPGSLLFWGCPHYHKLAEHLRLAQQIPLLHFLERHEGRGGIRVPQSGWFQEEAPNGSAVKPSGKEPAWKPIRDTYKRIYRQARKHRFEDHLVDAHEHRLPHVLFSTRSQDIDLYHKPMARNVQLWNGEYHAILDGPTASAEDIRRAAETVAAGGTFGYRFLWPAMCVGRHELYWHRPLVAYHDPRTKRPVLIDGAPVGYLTAYEEHSKSFNDPIELWPRFLRREPHLENVALFHTLQETPPWKTLSNVTKILDAHERNQSQPIVRTYARQLLTAPKSITLEGWLRGLPNQVKKPERERAARLVKHLRTGISSAHAEGAAAKPSLTFQYTANRNFEEAYWNTIAFLSAGKFVNKNNADCVLDHCTQPVLKHLSRDLESMGDHLLNYYGELIAERGMSDMVHAGELPFRWETQYPFTWMGGWQQNQEGRAYERNLLVVIPGRDRSRAVVMADHYDTAYMYDHYDRHEGGYGARLSAPGADDNCSATAALMLGAQAFLDLSRQGKLACDIWLLHLTGEEYPAEGLGACRVCQWLVEGTLGLHAKGMRHDLSGVRIQGIYVLDMIAHNVNQDRNVFQISPGVSRESQWLAYQAHCANQAWNQSTEAWNKQPARRRAGPGKRSRDIQTMPPIARYLPLHGEIRPHYDARSTLFNTDGQGFSDIGVPVVLFMENYDINRVGYHDTHDNMTLINLDYGAALAAITIESVARAAVEEPPAGYEVRGV
jgi:Peptidase family M28